ncbi:unnamed protein product [Boreogadus saida]
MVLWNELSIDREGEGLVLGYFYVFKSDAGIYSDRNHDDNKQKTRGPNSNSASRRRLYDSYMRTDHIRKKKPILTAPRGYPPCPTHGDGPCSTCHLLRPEELSAQGVSTKDLMREQVAVRGSQLKVKYLYEDSTYNRQGQRIATARQPLRAMAQLFMCPQKPVAGCPPVKERSVDSTGSSKGSSDSAGLQGSGTVGNSTGGGGSKLCGPLTSEQALRQYRNQLTSLEQTEIHTYPEIYFLGPNAKKRQAVVGGSNNSGYDDDQGGYIHVPHDHLAYRYEFLKVIGKGSFGQWPSMNLYELIKRNKFQGFSLRCPENILLKQQGRSGTSKCRRSARSAQGEGGGPLGLQAALEHQRVYTVHPSRFYRAPEVILGSRYACPSTCELRLYPGGAADGPTRCFPGEDEGTRPWRASWSCWACRRRSAGAGQAGKNFINSKGHPRYCGANTLHTGATVLTGSRSSRRGKLRGPPAAKEWSAALKGCEDPTFTDFLKKCLDWDPTTRLTPQPGPAAPVLYRRLPKPVPTDKGQGPTVKSSPTPQHLLPVPPGQGGSGWARPRPPTTNCGRHDGGPERPCPSAQSLPKLVS